MSLPTGVILPFGGSAAPTGYLLCDGSAVSRSTYADLFAAIGESFGEGDGETTFALPNFADNVPIGVGALAATLGALVGEATHALTTPELSSHTHGGPAHAHPLSFDTVPMISASDGSATNVLTNLGPSGATLSATGFDGSEDTSASGGGGAHNNVQPSIGVNFIIKT